MSHGPGSKAPAGLDVSRRGFLKGAGAIAAAPLLGAPLAAEAAQDTGISSAGPGEMPLSLNINGQTRTLKVEPRVTLLEALRDRLDITGPKEVCSRGSCGACTVIVDGRTVNSCMMLAADAAGARITTSEGLQQGDKIDAVPAAFAKHDAMQCGFCTPGLVMSVRALLDGNPQPTLEQVKKACSGNLCRCGTYPKVFEAALTAAGIATPVGNEADNKHAMENERSRVDALPKALGKAKYTADVNLKNMAYAQIIYCPYGKAVLKSADEAAARAVPGVLEVQVREKREFRYCGQPAGLVCGETRQAVADGIAALKLAWELQEPATNPLAEHEKKHGVFPPSLEKQKGRGDKEEVAAALKDGRPVEATYATQIQTHACLEPHGAVSHFRGDEADMWVSSQATGVVHGGAAQAFGLDRNKVTAHCEYCGGGFGSKFGIDAEGQRSAELSKKLNRPVKIINERKREQLDTGCRPGSLQYMQMAIGDDGKPRGGRIYVAGVSGIGGGGDARNPAHYNFGTVLRGGADVELSSGGARAMRAPGHPQGQFAVDSFVDELALAAKMDPLEYRKLIDRSAKRRQMYDVGAERIGWKNRPQPDGAGKGAIRRGMGMAVGDWGNGQGDAQIRIDVQKDGSLRVVSGTQDIGTGTRTVLADVVAYHLKLDRKLITADCGNSAYPGGPASGGSVVTRSIVPCIRDAAEKAKEAVEKKSGMKVTDEASWLKACAKLPEESITVVGSFNDDYWGEGGSEAVQFAEVEVDTETGVVKVLKVIALQACGKVVNRLTAENQVIGGVIQGVSYALFEEKLLDPRTGAMLNPNLEMYKIAGALDCPDIVPILWDDGPEAGARAIGEPAVIPTAAAIANAIVNATGARVRSLPITPAKVLAALAERGGV